MSEKKREKVEDLFEDVANRRGETVFGKTRSVSNNREGASRTHVEEKEVEALRLDLKTVSIRITEADQRVLAAYFREKYNIGLSTGIRTILKDYMRTNHIA